MGKLLGLTGNTGNVGGPHIHIAKWKHGNIGGGYYVSRYNRTYFPAGNSVFSAKGKVIEISTQNVGDAGKFVRWQADDGFTYEGFHLSQVNVKVGDIIGGNMATDALTRDEVIRNWRWSHREDPPESSVQFYTGKPLSVLQNDSLKSDKVEKVHQDYLEGLKARELGNKLAKELFETGFKREPTKAELDHVKDWQFHHIYNYWKTLPGWQATAINDIFEEVKETLYRKKN